MKANEQGPGCVYILNILGAMGQAQVSGSPWVCPSTSIHGMNQPRVPDPSLIVHRSSELSRWRSMSDNITFDNCGGDFPLFLVEFMPPSSSSSQAFGPQAAVQDLHIAPYKLDDAHPGCAALLHWVLRFTYTLWTYLWKCSAKYVLCIFLTKWKSHCFFFIMNRLFHFNFFWSEHSSD